MTREPTGRAPVSPQPESDRDPEAVAGALVGAMLAMVALLLVGNADDHLLAWLIWVGFAIVGGAAGGTAIGLLASRLTGRGIARLGTWCGAVGGACVAGAVAHLLGLLAPLPRAVDPTGTPAAWAIGAAAGALAVFLVQGSSPAYYYGLARLRLRGGDRDGACEAIGWYLIHCRKDPRAATRRPIAEHFLRDPNASLEVPTELLTADPPAGRGTELEHTSQPAGRGTELEGRR